MNYREMVNQFENILIKSTLIKYNFVLQMIVAFLDNFAFEIPQKGCQKFCNLKARYNGW